MRHPKPGSLTAIQVILFIQSALAGLVYLLAFVGMGTMGEAEIQSVAGMSSGAFMVVMLIGVATTAFYVYVAATIGRGGHRTRTLVRVVVGIGTVFAVINMLTDGSGFVGLVLMIVVLVLNEGEAAKRWYEETEHPGGYQRS